MKATAKELRFESKKLLDVVAHGTMSSILLAVNLASNECCISKKRNHWSNYLLMNYSVSGGHVTKWIKLMNMCAIYAKAVFPDINRYRHSDFGSIGQSEC